jgi:hypothetical protein
MSNQAKNFVRVVSHSVQSDKNGREYNRVTLQQLQGREEIADPDTGEALAVIGPEMTVNITGYKIPYYYELDDPKARPDYVWNAREGQAIQGVIVRTTVEPYMIGERTVSTATVFVQGDPDGTDFEMRKTQAFERSGRTVVYAGALFGDDSVVRPRGNRISVPVSNESIEI